MTKKATGEACRESMTLLQVADKFPDEDAAREWLESIRWSDGPLLPALRVVQCAAGIKHKTMTMTHRCRDCKSRPICLRCGPAA